VRIVGGSLGGRRFQPPAGIPARPTTDLAREALFNMLEHTLDWQGLQALDLFSGTGSLSYELLSRGAQAVVAVEQHGPSVAFIKKTAESLGIADGLTVLRNDVFRFLKREEGRYGFVFADPPYALPRMGDLLGLMLPRLRDDGLAVLEHDTRHHFESHPHFLRAKSYGDTIFSFFTAQPKAAQ
jgi:16S rRNA (guanine(966)-N(2))-methyltransferase RsmD